MEKKATETGRKCIAPGCAKEGHKRLGVKCSIAEEGQAALFAPEAEAYLCDDHARGGAQMTLLFEPDSSGESTIKIIAVERAEERATRTSSKAGAIEGDALTEYPHLQRQAEEMMLREMVVKLAEAFGWVVNPSLPQVSGNRR